MSAVLEIKAYFDLICPWCLIGKRHLQTAIDQFEATRPDVSVVVHWRSHQLLADLPAAGVPYQAFYERRLGGPEAVIARRAQVQAAAQTAGLTLAFERIEWMPNTLAAHLLIDQLRPQIDAGQLAELIERLFAGYFLAGRNIGDPVVLRQIAAEAGVPATMLAACLDTPEERQRFSDRLAGSADPRLSGVPFFAFNDRLAISGAQPPASLLAAMERALSPAPAFGPA